MTYRPRLSSAFRPPTIEVDSVNERGERLTTAIAGEYPLTIYLDKRELVTLMTLGQRPEALVLGYLRNQRLVRSLAEIEAVQVDWEVGACAVTSFAGIDDLDSRLATRTVTTGCGQGTVFGDLMAEIDSIELPADRRLSEATYYRLLDNVRRYDSVYKAAGAVHGCALARGEEILYFVEDVGRHNAVDAIAGQMWLDAVEGCDKIFYTTGRLTSEMVIKCAQMGIPFLVSRSGLTQMGHALARRVGITMIGRATGKHYLLFTGEHRFVRSPRSERAAAPVSC
ncbi:MAG: formate dehydrogenase accessory sulfurtransferase FdhD [Burkholderiales bacterium]|nr:formate dehydrogenase accessory sulfurtransferase FdhD [Burkholderiales bacterium]